MSSKQTATGTSFILEIGIFIKHHLKSMVELVVDQSFSLHDRPLHQLLKHSHLVYSS